MESDKKVFEVEKKRFFLNTRQKTIFFISLSLLFVFYVFIHRSLITDVLPLLGMRGVPQTGQK